MVLGRRNGLRGTLESMIGGEALVYIPCGTVDGGGDGIELYIVDAVSCGEWAVPFKCAMGYVDGGIVTSGDRKDDACVGGGNGLMIPGWPVGC